MFIQFFESYPREMLSLPTLLVSVPPIQNGSRMRGSCIFRLGVPLSQGCDSSDSCRCIRCAEGHHDLLHRHDYRWNMLMVNFVSRSNVYPVQLPIPISIDVHLKSTRNVSIHAYMLSAVSVTQIFKIEAVSQTIFIPTSALSAAVGTASQSVWVSLLFRLVSDELVCKCLADDCLDMRLLVSPASAATAFGFESPPMEIRPPPPIVHFVHLTLGPSHQRQLAAVRSGRAAVVGAVAAQKLLGVCSELFLMAVRAAEKANFGGQIILHTDWPEHEVAACPELPTTVRVAAVIVPQSVGGRLVRWHQHQADVVSSPDLKDHFQA
jgi:hypothetical protein